MQVRVIRKTYNAFDEEVSLIGKIQRTLRKLKKLNGVRKIKKFRKYLSHALSIEADIFEKFK